MLHLPMHIPPDLHLLYSDVPADVFDRTFRAASQRMDRYIGSLTVELAAALGITSGEVANASELVASRGWSRDGELAVSWLLETLELYAFARRHDPGWFVELSTSLPPSAALRQEAVAALPSSEPAYRVFELSAQLLPAVLAGQARGEDALFGPAAMGVWFDYFSNDNPHYAPNNVLAAIAVARCAKPGVALLEVGGGAGSAALATLAALAEQHCAPARYTFTELHPAFLRRGSRALQGALPPGCAFEPRRVDINAGLLGQGLAPESYDVIFGVNTLHLALDLVGCLGELRALLRPGGCLVIGELVRPPAERAVHLELPFTLLEAYRAGAKDQSRPRAGFQTAATWTRVLADAGFARSTLLPAQIERCAGLYPGFYAGVITGHTD